jgi:hypothetical protein
MGLSRLDNFLKSVRGTILYVDPNSIDSTDSVDNQGNSLTRPFKTIQRALVEAARFSYQRGLNNDRFGRTTILLYPGDHVVDNRPGWIPDGANNFRLRNGLTSNDFPAWDSATNYDLTTNNNALYKLNSIHGGVIVPRGTSIVGLDLRKTKIRPKYVPNPENDQIERSCVFRVTGGCYFWQFSIFDSDPNDICYKDYTTNIFVPNFSHHKLTCFEYADGVNPVVINDDFNTFTSDKTDLDFYYAKVGLAYGTSSGRDIQPDFPVNPLDIQSKVDEFRIVGSLGAEVGITSIRAGDGVTSSTTITATLSESATQFDVDTPIIIKGVGSSGYDGQFVVSNKIDDTSIQYRVQNSPADPLPSISGATISISVDTVTSASPYIFNVSLRSVYGMCGLHADGDKASGFKSMVVAQFTGIGLQKDNNAFVRYDESTGTYQDSTATENENLQSDSLSRYKPSYENYHIKASNDAYVQVVSVFAIGYANHFLSVNGGDQSINNSNSNFGAISLRSAGFKRTAFPREDLGYITHVIPPKDNESVENGIEFYSIDVSKTIGIGSVGRLYLYSQTNPSIAPDSTIDGYRIGAKENETLNLLITQSGISSTYSARVVMPNSQTSSEKKFTVGRNTVGINSISSNVITLSRNHDFINGESIRVISETANLPNDLKNNTVYYAITSGTGITGQDQIKVAQTLNNALTDNPIGINNKGIFLSVVSRVSDKKAGDIGHPVQFDSASNQWYVKVATASTENNLYSTIVSLGVGNLGSATPRTYFTRKPDTRNLTDTIYRLRYVVPSDTILQGKPPTEGYVIQESNVSVASTSEIQTLYSPNFAQINNLSDLRNVRFIANASWSGGTANIITEIPHDLTIGSQVEVINVKSTNNTTGVANSAYNGTFTVSGISSAKHFSFAITNNPGTFTSDTSTRTSSLPQFKKKQTSAIYYIYRSEEIQKYIAGRQDGIYHLTVLNSSNSPVVSPFTSLKFSQPIQNLYPQVNRDNPNSDPQSATSYALPDVIGQVVVNEPQYSITKETLNKNLFDTGVGVALTNLVSNSVGTSHTFFTSVDHGFNRITELAITNAGTNYVDGNYFNVNLVGFSGSTTGSHATARVTVSGGSITSVKIIDGGSAYGIGNTLAVVGVATTTSNTPALLTVNKIYNNIGDTLSLDGITRTTHTGYNNLYRISQVLDPKTVVVASASTISPAYTVGIGVTIASTANAVLLGRTLNVHSIVYNQTTGIATVFTSQNHGFQVDNKVRLGGVVDNFFNTGFVVKAVGTTTSFTINPGTSTTSRSTSGTIFAYPPSYASSGGNINPENEDSSGRLIPEYAGITTTLSLAVGVLDTSISITNVSDFDFNVGDYIIVNNEIMRIRTSIIGNPVSVFRGVLGTKTTNHNSGAIVKRINPRPIELRRNSLLRASAHTFEYLGLGPGNYSTALTDKQDRTLTPQEEFLAQVTKSEGGAISFTGMNDKGDYYLANKKINSSTGKEQSFDTPIPTVTGEDVVSSSSVGIDIQTPDEISVSRSIRVEGGPDSNVISQFDGPVIFNNRITSTSSKGIEANSIFLQGDTNVSRKHTVGIATPVLAGNPGDVHYNAIPTGGDFVGWVYTNNNRWEEFGYIGDPARTGVDVSSNGTYVGFSTLINFNAGVGATILSSHDIPTGITTLTFQASPLQVGISTGIGLGKIFAGIATEINFIGYGITIIASQNAGIASVTFDASGSAGNPPGLPANSIQYNAGGFFGGSSALTFDGTNVFVGNSIGINSATPSSKLDIISTTFSGNIVKVDNVFERPVTISYNGNVGIGTNQALDPLDVRGNVSVGGTVKIYNADNINYLGLKAPSLLSNYELTFPTSIGSSNNVLYTTGSGILDWISPQSLVALAYTNTDSLPEGSNNLYFTTERAQDAIGVAITSGTQNGITVTYDDVNNRINFNSDAASPYPFTTRGFSIPL